MTIQFTPQTAVLTVWAGDPGSPETLQGGGQSLPTPGPPPAGRPCVPMHPARPPIDPDPPQTLTLTLTRPRPPPPRAQPSHPVSAGLCAPGAVCAPAPAPSPPRPRGWVYTASCGSGRHVGSAPVASGGPSPTSQTPLWRRGLCPPMCPVGGPPPPSCHSPNPAGPFGCIAAFPAAETPRRHPPKAPAQSPQSAPPFCTPHIPPPAAAPLSWGSGC